MHHVLVISDILDSIFRFTDTSTNVACARVCKAWQENVLDILWYRIDHLEPLFRLLGPMGEINPQLVTLVHNNILNERWDRFSFYANRVRHLEVTDRLPEVHHQSFSTLSIARPVLHLLPNLTHLTWKKDPARPTVSLVLCLLFLTPGLKSLSVATGHSSEQGDLFTIDNFFKDVVHRSPRIECLEFRSYISFYDIEPCLSNFLTGLSGLKTVLLSDPLLTSDVITALAKCPLLESIRMTDPSESIEVEGETDYLQNYMPMIEDGAFPSLREIEIKAHLWNVTSFLHSDIPAARLRRLIVRTLVLDDNATVAIFFARVTKACPEIEVLALSLQGGVEDGSESLPFAYLEPLLRCTSLTAFTLNMPLPLDIDDAEGTLIASSWPHLRDLHLNPFPAMQRPAGKHLTFAVLASFAQHCPHLRTLGLYILSSSLPQSTGRKVIPELRSLMLGLVGTSYVVEDLALFLTDITPAKCSIIGSPFVSIDLQAHVHVAEVKLNKVLTLLPMLRSIHAQYQERLRVLEAEVRRLSLLAVPAVQP